MSAVSACVGATVRSATCRVINRSAASASRPISHPPPDRAALRPSSTTSRATPYGRLDAAVQLVAVLCLTSLGFVLLIPGTPPLVVAGALISGGVGWGWTALLNLVAVRAERYTPAEAVGIVMSGVFLGALAGPLLVGLVAGSIGFDAAWAMGATVLAAAGTVTVAQRQQRS
jgi:MFS family permease